jgi:hypothetical protein
VISDCNLSVSDISAVWVGAVRVRCRRGRAELCDLSTPIPMISFVGGPRQ